MTDHQLDSLDREILHQLQVNARGSRDTDIADATGVTSTTVSNRIDNLESHGIIRGYHPDIDYERAGYPLVVLFVCSASVTERSRLATEVLGVAGVVNVRELMRGEENVHVEAAAKSITDTERITTDLDATGLDVVRSEIAADETVQPWNHFRAADADATDD